MFTHTQVSKSFLEPLGINNDSIAKTIFLEEFIQGKKATPKKSNEKTQEERDVLYGIKNKLQNYYSWIWNSSAAEMAGQNCSDMLVSVGKIQL